MFSFGTVEVRDLRTDLPKNMGIKTNFFGCLRSHRHIMLNIDQYEAYVGALSKSVNILPFHLIALPSRATSLQGISLETRFQFKRRNFN